MTFARRLALVALVFLPACQNCESCNDDEEKKGLGDTPRSEPAASDTSATKYLRKPLFRHWKDAGRPDGGGVASDASIE